MSSVHLGLLGKIYKDHIVYMEKMKAGETNEESHSEDRLGGAFNIIHSNLGGIDARCFLSGTKEVIILSEMGPSRRTAIVKDSEEGCVGGDVYDNAQLDWLHVMYIDDYYPIDMSRITSPISIDFCTNNKREGYEHIIDQCDLVFDSRERKHLYSNINTLSPLIFHDEYGCECVVDGETIYESKIDPVPGLKVNGAGDIFAAIFIREFLANNRSGLEEATKKASVLATNTLKNTRS